MITTILLQAAPQDTGFAAILKNPIFTFGLIAIIFYFFMIRPQVKKQKDQKSFVTDLKKGDKVITTAGIHGKITDIGETTFLVEVDNGVKIRFDKSAISLEASKALNAPVVTKS
jgi:preprotein translocase subunit YajC